MMIYIKIYLCHVWSIYLVVIVLRNHWKYHYDSNRSIIHLPQQTQQQFQQLIKTKKKTKQQYVSNRSIYTFIYLYAHVSFEAHVQISSKNPLHFSFVSPLSLMSYISICVCVCVELVYTSILSNSFVAILIFVSQWSLCFLIYISHMRI